jgi:isoquinoline 1-oxidoreductase subunit alpha
MNGSAAMRIEINGITRALDVDGDKPLLWVLREDAGLAGTKFGCGIGACGACTVHVNGEPTRSCVTRVAEVANAQVITVEGLSADRLGAMLQEAWIEHDVPQCGYCQSGMLMAAVVLLRERGKALTESEVDAGITNICRCGTYHRVKRVMLEVAERLT